MIFTKSHRDWSDEPTPFEVTQGQTLLIMDSGIGDDSNNQCQNSGSLFELFYIRTTLNELSLL